MSFGWIWTALIGLAALFLLSSGLSAVPSDLVSDSFADVILS